MWCLQKNTIWIRATAAVTVAAIALLILMQYPSLKEANCYL